MQLTTVFTGKIHIAVKAVFAIVIIRKTHVAIFAVHNVVVEGTVFGIYIKTSEFRYIVEQVFKLVEK
jgi:hypothetical protein